MRCFIAVLLSLSLLAVSSPAQARRGRKPRPLTPVTDAGFARLAAENGAETPAVYESSVGRFIYDPGPGGGSFWFLTGDHARPEGYQGPTSVAVEISGDGKKIKRCVLVESRETLSYVKKYFERGSKKGGNPFFNQFRDMVLGPGEKDVIPEVDAVSGATMTSRAIRRAVEATCRKVLPMIRSGVLKDGKVVNEGYAVREAVPEGPARSGDE
ncbi:MAG TPA: hypothetical protein DDW67_09315 [Elusimicrobia bacterium]|nr:hypothetical protein [Elusimicrobiota bacterium]